MVMAFLSHASKLQILSDPLEASMKLLGVTVSLGISMFRELMVHSAKEMHNAEEAQ